MTNTNIIDQHNTSTDAPAVTPIATLSPAKRCIQFGIPTLDELIGSPIVDEVRTYGIQPPSPDDDEPGKTSVCIIGPDGTGKSVLALHLASRYCADAEASCRVLYASTDLSRVKARLTWEKFRLNQPNSRVIPFLEKKRRPDHWAKEKVNISLQYCTPGDNEEATSGDKTHAVSAWEFLLTQPEDPAALERQVGFIDLEGATAGDDWGFLTRILATLKEPKKGGSPHLLIVDAVEGLETLVGDLDAYGQPRSRRSRVAQIMRAAGRKCHIVFVVEEPVENTRLPEEFVTDVVVRLRCMPQRHSVRRMVEVVKARGQAHEHGLHDFVIREGSGTTTGMQQNSDDPRVMLPKVLQKQSQSVAVSDVIPSPPTAQGSSSPAPSASNTVIEDQGTHLHTSEKTQAYFHVFHSVDHLTRKRMRRSMDEDPIPMRVSDLSQPGAHACAGFGIEYLDDMLAQDTQQQNKLPEPVNPVPTTPVPGAKLDQEKPSRHGLPGGSLTALIGDDGTHKNRLGRAFLSHAFLSEKNGIIGPEVPANPLSPEYGVAVLLTTQDLFAEGLVHLFWKHMPREARLKARMTRPPRTALPASASQAGAAATISSSTQFVLTEEDCKEEDGLIKQIALAANPLTQSLKEYFTLSSDPPKAIWDDVKNRKEVLRKKLFSQDNYSFNELIKTNPFDNLQSNKAKACLSKIYEFVAISDAFHEETKKLCADIMRVKPLPKDIDKIKNLNRMILEDFFPDYIYNRALEPLLNHTICRRLDFHQAFSSSLMHVVQCAIQEAKLRLNSSPAPTPDESHRSENYTSERAASAERIRVVFYDWSTVKDAYPDVANDPLFLPYLLRYLKLEGITTLFVDTQAGNPRHIMREEADRELRSLVDYHLYTWQVPFFGESRIAIAAIPPIRDHAPVAIRELRPGVGSNNERLEVDPHFEKYMGLEEDRPERVPLRVRLFAPYTQFDAYIKQANNLFDQLFRPVPTYATTDAIQSGQPSTTKMSESAFTRLLADKRDHVIQKEGPDEYEAMQEFYRHQTQARREFSEIFQVDEFWSPPHKTSALEQTYLLSHGYIDHSKIDDTKLIVSKKERHRKFEPIGYQCDATHPPEMLDRIPYMWDFGMLLCLENAWKEAGSEIGNRSQNMLVSDIWNSMTNPGQETVCWRDFLEACYRLRNKISPGHLSDPTKNIWSKENIVELFAFSLETQTFQTLPCLVFEVWASEIDLLKAKQSTDETAKQVKGGFDIKSLLDSIKVRKRSDPISGSNPASVRDLRKMLEAPECKKALFKSLLLLSLLTEDRHMGEVQPLSDQTKTGNNKNLKLAVATRHWYSTACECVRQHELNRDKEGWKIKSLPKKQDGRGPQYKNQPGEKSSPVDLMPVGLPGSFAVRGDWFLAMTHGSRSWEIVCEAIDRLSTKQTNATRLNMGLGLPTVGLADPDNQPTALFGAEHKPLNYSALLALGSSDGHTGATSTSGRTNFYWFWRSTLLHYDRHAPTWHQWLCRELAMMQVNIPSSASTNTWDDRLSLYDKFETIKPDSADYKYFSDFSDRVKILQNSLETAQEDELSD